MAKIQTNTEKTDSHLVETPATMAKPETTSEDTGIIEYKPLIQPDVLKYEVPITNHSLNVVRYGRNEAIRVINQQSDRLLVLIGPCSIHDPEMALEYARRLKELASRFEEDLCIIMRAYLEKPRTTVGWKGLINDPRIDGSFEINSGLRTARRLFAEITNLGLPLATEMLDTISPQYLADLISVSAIGARTTESPLHRELASGVSFPVGFKNATNGSIDVAVDAVTAAASQHHFIGVTQEGRSAITSTTGNKNCFIILRGGKKGPNYDSVSVNDALEAMRSARKRPVVMVDCSHGNLSKDYRNQPKVARAISEQIQAGQAGIVGVMLESNIHAGRQEVGIAGAIQLEKGISITDGCISFESTVQVIEELASAVRTRRELVSASSRSLLKY